MDSFTQVVLGAAVGEAVLGKKVGNKALLWGAIAGTIPDLDVFLVPFFNDVDALYIHRGYSHSLLFSLLFAPVLGFIITKIYKKKRQATFKQWTTLAFMSLVTHPLLDIFTIYGTPIFLPFSNYRVAFASVNVVDFFYTVPFLFSVLIILFSKKRKKLRRIVSFIGLTLSTLYLMFTLINKFYIDDFFEKNLKKQHYNYTKIKTTPLPGTNFLWQCVAKTDSGFYIGLHSIIKDNVDVEFSFIPQNKFLISDIKANEQIKKLIKFTDGFYVLKQQNDTIVFSDLKFGKTGFKNSSDFIFSFYILKNQDKLYIERHINIPENKRFYIKNLFNRTFNK